MRSDVRTAVAPGRKAAMLSRPLPKSSERGRGLTRIGATDRVACVIHGRGARAPIILPLVTPEGIVAGVIAARAGIARRLRRLLRRRRIGKPLPGACAGGARDIGAGRSVGASTPIICPLVAPEGIVAGVVAAGAGIANRLRRGRIDKTLPGARSGDSFLRRGAGDVGAGRSGGASAPVICPLATPEGIALDVVAPRAGSANRLLHLLLRRR